MALTPIPKKKPEPENDTFKSVENKALNRIKKEKEIRKEKLKNEDIKKATMDFIFGKSNENPLGEGK